MFSSSKWAAVMGRATLPRNGGTDGIHLTPLISLAFPPANLPLFSLGQNDSLSIRFSFKAVIRRIWHMIYKTYPKSTYGLYDVDLIDHGVLCGSWPWKYLRAALVIVEKLRQLEAHLHTNGYRLRVPGFPHYSGENGQFRASTTRPIIPTIKSNHTIKFI